MSMPANPLTEHSGLQYTDKAYVVALLLILLPVSVVSLVCSGYKRLPNKMMYYSFLPSREMPSIYDTSWWPYKVQFVVTFIHLFGCVIWTSPQGSVSILTLLGVPIAVLVLVVSGVVSAFYTELFAWHITALWQILVIYGTIFQLIASVTPFKLGVLAVIPGYLTATIYVQFIVQILFFSLMSLLTYIFINYLGWTDGKFSSSWYNGLSSILSSYFVFSGTSYIILITGLSFYCCFDPIGLFSTPSPLSLSNIVLIILLFSWVVLAYAGWKTQMNRDTFLHQQRRDSEEIRNKNYDASDEKMSLLQTKDIEEDFLY